MHGQRNIKTKPHVKFPKTQERNKLELISTDEAQIVLRRMKQQEAGENRVIRAEEMGGV
jgi:hypothetical protein